MTIDNVIAGELIDPAWGNSVADAINPTAWTAPSFLNSWVNFGGVYQVAQYRKINDMVYVRGLVKSGTITADMFVLPVGFRPPAGLILPTVAGNGSLNDVGYLEIATTGGIKYFGTTGYTAYVSLAVAFSVTA